jgi:lysophospholipase L1-like esterase
MTARGRFMARLVTMVIALAGFVTVGALPAAAGNSGTVQYVALGDSYAAGQGGGDEIRPCLQSPNGYPYLLDSKMRIDLRANAACTGASTSEVSEVISKPLPELNQDTGLVTLTVGAADLNLSGVLAACTAPIPTNCQTLIQQALAQLSVFCGGGSDMQLLKRLRDLYSQVAGAAPNALIVVTGYPYLFEPPAEDDPNADIINAVNSATAALNCTIQQAVADAQSAGKDIVYVDVTAEFAGHGIDSKKPFINSDGVGAYHPNAAGYRAYAKAIFAAIRSAWLDDNKHVA